MRDASLRGEEKVVEPVESVSKRGGGGGGSN